MSKPATILTSALLSVTTLAPARVLAAPAPAAAASPQPAAAPAEPNDDSPIYWGVAGGASAVGIGIAGVTAVLISRACPAGPTDDLADLRCAAGAVKHLRNYEGTAGLFNIGSLVLSIIGGVRRGPAATYRVDYKGGRRLSRGGLIGAGVGLTAVGLAGGIATTVLGHRAIDNCGPVRCVANTIGAAIVVQQLAWTTLSLGAGLLSFGARYKPSKRVAQLNFNPMLGRGTAGLSVAGRF